jgi:hypothetical protein
VKIVAKEKMVIDDREWWPFFDVTKNQDENSLMVGIWAKGDSGQLSSGVSRSICPNRGVFSIIFFLFSLRFKIIVVKTRFLVQK